MERTFAMWKRLSDDGIFANVVVPPAVPAGACLIRMTLTAAQTDEQIDRVLAVIERAGVELGVIGGGRVRPLRRVG